MAEAYKLLLDSVDVPPLEVLTEQANKDEPKKLYVEGIFGQAGKVNKNGRVYDLQEMIQDIGRFNEEFVKTGRAGNELSHPSSPEINLERICDRTVSLTIDESTGTVFGKALVLDTPMGLIEKALIEGGTKVGKSSRAMGQLRESRGSQGQTFNQVNGLRLVCFDSVSDPSVSSAMVDPLLEKKEWIINGSDWSVKPFDNFQSSLDTLPRKNKEEYLVECVKNFLAEFRNQ